MFHTRPLDESTWNAFEELVSRHNGVWGGCWCLEFHPEGKIRGAERRQIKYEKVRTGSTHATLVFDEDRCVGWCQYGSAVELPRIKHRRKYENSALALPDWRITCFFVDSQYRKRGISEIALTQTLQEISRNGGGVVESYPEEITTQKTSAAFLHNCTTSIFLRNGFIKIQKLGKSHWIMRKIVDKPLG